MTMMILPRHLLIGWIKFFIIIFISLSTLTILGDLVNNVLRNKYTIVQIFQNLYFHLPMIAEQAIPVSGFMASLFLIQQLKTHGELVSILSFGISLQRIAIYILPGALLCCGGLIALMGFISPAMERLSEQYQIKQDMQSEQKPGSSSAVAQNKVWLKRRNYFLSYEFFDRKHKTLFQPRIILIDDQFRGQAFYLAKRARYLEASKQWELQDYREITALAKADFPLTSAGKSLKLSISDGPELLGQFQGGVDTLNILSLYRFITQLDDKEMNIRDYQLKVFEPLGKSFLLLILILWPIFYPSGISSRHEAGNSGVWLGALKMGLLLGGYFLAIKLMHVPIIPIFIQVFLYPVLCLMLLKPWTWPEKLILSNR